MYVYVMICVLLCTRMCKYSDLSMTYDLRYDCWCCMKSFSLLLAICLTKIIFFSYEIFFYFQEILKF